MRRSPPTFLVALLALASLPACRGAGPLTPQTPALAGPSKTHVTAASGAAGGIVTAIVIGIPTSKTGVASFVLSERDANAVPGAPVTIGVRDCPHQGGQIQCRAALATGVGLDTFSIAAYSGSGGTGYTLATAIFAKTISARGVVRVVYGDRIAALTLTPDLTPSLGTSLPLGQTELLSIDARNAAGETILGPYAAPVTLSGTHLAFAQSSLASSSDAANASVSWAYGFPGTSNGTMTASSGAARSTVTLAPATGVTYYRVPGQLSGNTSPRPASVLAAAGGIYYADANRIGKLDPASQRASEITLPTTAVTVALYASSDGALWIATSAGLGGGTPQPGEVFRMPPGSFSAAALQRIPELLSMSFAQDAHGLLWSCCLYAANAHVAIQSISLNGLHGPPPVRTYVLPSCQQTPDHAGTIVYAGNGLLYLAEPSSGKPYGFAGKFREISPHKPTASNCVAGTPRALTGGIAAADARLWVTIGGNGSAGFFAYDPKANTWRKVKLSNVGAQLASNGTAIVSSQYATELYVPATGDARTLVTSSFTSSAAPDARGNIWLDGSCPLAAAARCIGRATYLSGWSLLPKYTPFAPLFYAPGLQAGIMEQAGATSGPFTATVVSGSQNCTASKIAADLSFYAYDGQSHPEQCVIAVTDAHHQTQTMRVTFIPVVGERAR